MGLFGNNSGGLELAKQKVHLSNDYLQALTPLIESITANENFRQEILNKLLLLAEEIDKSTNNGTQNTQVFSNAVELLDSFTKYSKESANFYTGVLKYYTDMGDRTKELFELYKQKGS